MRGTSNAASGLPWREVFAVLVFAAAASLIAIRWSRRNDALLNYGDAVAHLHIARHVFDCRFHSIGEFGSVWLPLPHILMLPFVQVYAWWANGIAGLIPSALAYLAGGVGLYRLARRWLEPAAAALALGIFALNPNLLYLQTTAMTEPLFLCEMIWAVVWLVEWRGALDTDPKRAARLEWLVLLALVAAVFTRYDGWIIALLAWFGMGVRRLRSGQLGKRSFWIASVILAAAPASWFIYNATQFGDWLDFARGPYSALAIEMRTAAPGWPPHPGWHNPWVSELFFIKVAEMDALAAWRHVLLALSVIGTAFGCVIARRRGFLWTLLLWISVPFYAYSVAYGSVPIFIPVWWPHSYYNTRYGMELLPAIALGLGFVAQFAIGAVREFKPVWRSWAISALAALVVFNSLGLIHKRPLVYVESTKNVEARRPFDENIPPVMRQLLSRRPGAPVLMNSSVYPELIAFSGIPLAQTINESDQYVYRDALAAPAEHAAIVVAFDGDEIDRAVKAHPEGLIEVAHFTAKGQAAGTIYVSGTWHEGGRG
ncbi:MAG: hypothetical protein WBE74_02515 [Terracidiphilus sp.]